MQHARAKRINNASAARLTPSDWTSVSRSTPRPPEVARSRFVAALTARGEQGAPPISQSLSDPARQSAVRAKFVEKSFDQEYRAPRSRPTSAPRGRIVSTRPPSHRTRANLTRERREKGERTHRFGNIQSLYIFHRKID